jgi:hypothetical protein
MGKASSATDEIREVSKKIAAKILDHGLAHSTWAHNYPEAYQDLLRYRADVELSAEVILLKSSLGKPEG